MHNIRKTFRNKARQRISAINGMSQKKLAEILGVSPVTVNQTLSEEIDMGIGLDRLQDWADALETTPEWLITDDSQKANSSTQQDLLGDLSQRIHSGDAAFALAQLALPGITPEVFELLSVSPDPKWWRIAYENLKIAAATLAPGANLPAKRELPASPGQVAGRDNKNRRTGR